MTDWWSIYSFNYRLMDMPLHTYVHTRRTTTQLQFGHGYWYKVQTLTEKYKKRNIKTSFNCIALHCMSCPKTSENESARGVKFLVWNKRLLVVPDTDETAFEINGIVSSSCKFSLNSEYRATGQHTCCTLHDLNKDWTQYLGLLQYVRYTTPLYLAWYTSTERERLPGIKCSSPACHYTSCSSHFFILDPTEDLVWKPTDWLAQTAVRRLF